MTSTPPPSHPPIPLTFCKSALPLRLWDWGATLDDAPPVVFVHGFLDAGRSWAAVANGVRDFCRPLALDWRGHGESGRAIGGASYHQYDHLKDLTRLMDELHAEALANNTPPPRTLVAHSMGASIALLCAGLAPEMLDHLIILDNLGGFAKDAVDNIDRWAEVLDSVRKPKKAFRIYASKEDAARHVQENNPQMTTIGIDRFLAASLVPVQGSTGFEFQFDRELRGPNPLSFPESHWLELCKRVTAKVHVLIPEFGFFAQHNSPMQTRLQTLRDGESTWLKDTSHHVHVDRPDAVAKVLWQALKPVNTSRNRCD